MPFQQDADDTDNDDDSEQGDRLQVEDGLSESVLAALLEFQQGGGRFATGDDDDNDENEDDDTDRISRDTVCAVYRPEDSAVIAATLRRLEQKRLEQEHVHGCDNEKSDTGGGADPVVERVVGQLQVDETTRNSWTVLQEEGVVRINNVLSSELCAACLNYINEALLDVTTPSSEASTLSDNNAGTTTTTPGFGNVFERDYRCDMYLRNTGVVNEALHYMLHKSAPLGRLFDELLHGAPSADFHELSSLVADPGCVAQPIHPDAPYTTSGSTSTGTGTSDDAAPAPLWTCFVALQTVRADMGGTVFLPRTHTAAAHSRLTSTAPGGAHERKRWLQHDCAYQRADLACGDCAVMDARTLHYGGANTTASKMLMIDPTNGPSTSSLDGTSNILPERRTLLYFTIRNPLHTSGYPPCGSLYADLDGVLTTAAYIQ